MKSKVINNCRNVYEVVIEKIMEFKEFLKYEFRRSKGYKSNLVEIYRIKERYINDDFVTQFLNERQKNIGPDRYRIEIIIDKTQGEEETVGEVMLMRKKRLIEKAELITKPNVPNSEKLIYWKF